MSKTEFLAELAKHLRMLEDSELQDILAEYAQHIDMKMQGGLSEVEAIQDFGPVRELATEILTAYHVRPDFSPKEDGKNHIFYVKAPDMEKLKQGSKQAANAVGRQAGRFGSWLKSLGAKIRTGFRRIATWGQEMFPGSENSYDTSHISLWFANLGRGLGRMFRWLGRGIVALVHWMGKGIVILVRWIWNVAWGGIAVVLGMVGLLSLFLFGLLLVWLIQGYPFTGLTIGAFGLTLVMGSLTCLAWTPIRRKRHTQPPATPPTQVYQAEPVFYKAEQTELPPIAETPPEGDEHHA